MSVSTEIQQVNIPTKLKLKFFPRRLLVVVELILNLSRNSTSFIKYLE